MIRKFLAILIISCLVSCVAMTPIPVAGDLEMDFPIEDPDNLSEGTIERHSIETVSYTHLTLPTICSV